MPVDAVRADPTAAAGLAVKLLEERVDRILVHFDVDVVDFTDTSLSENTGRNEGLPYPTAARALQALLASPRVAGLTITELVEARDNWQNVSRPSNAVTVTTGPTGRTSTIDVVAVDEARNASAPASITVTVP